MSSVDDAIAKAVKAKPVKESETKTSTVDDTFINDPALPEIKPIDNSPVYVKVYDVTNDGILGSNTQPGDGITILKGRVTDIDLEAAAVDKEWLIKTGMLVEAGYAPAS